jgi:fermentation-respiration switch protein FrsA (DUF1100 family)
MTLRNVLWVFPPLALGTIPFWRRSWKHRMTRYALEFAFWYALVLLLLILFENRLLFKPASAASWVSPPASLHVHDVTFVTQDGTRIHGWWCPTDDWTPYQGATIYCHGNMGNLTHHIPEAVAWQDNMHQAVLTFDYPGYGRSEGSPSEAGCYAAAEAAYDWLVKEQHVQPERVILLGGSLGGGVIADLASRHAHYALVLVSTFTSIPDVAQRIYFLAPVRYLARNRFASLSKIKDCKGPIFIAHGTADLLIPIAQGERLFAEANEPKQFFAMKGGRHNEIISPECFIALRQFLHDHPPAK